MNMEIKANQNRHMEGMFATFLLLNGAYDKGIAYQPKEFDMDLSPIGVILNGLGKKVMDVDLPKLADVGVYALQRKLVKSSRLAMALSPYYTSAYRRKERQRICYFNLPIIDFAIKEANANPSLQENKYNYIRSLIRIIKQIAEYVGVPTNVYCEKLKEIIPHYMVTNDLLPHELMLFFGHRDQFDRMLLLFQAVSQIQTE
jgi:hypothetical protein